MGNLDALNRRLVIKRLSLRRKTMAIFLTSTVTVQLAEVFVKKTISAKRLNVGIITVYGGPMKTATMLIQWHQYLEIRKLA